jgi:hypothetical protein
MQNNKIDEVTDVENKGGQKIGVDVTSNKWNIAAKISLYLINMAIMGVIGASAGYYAALSIPVPNQVMVFDLDKAMRTAAVIAEKSGKPPKQIADEIVAESKARIKQYTDAGVIVIDKASVIESPENLYVSTENLANETPSDKKPVSKEEMDEKLKQLTIQLELLEKSNSKK